MKKFLLCIALPFILHLSANAQYLVSTELMFSWTTGQLALQNVFGAQNGVSMYKIIYNTTDAQGEPTIASGAMFVPDLEGCDLPVAVYNHGTIYLKTDVPSYNNGEALVGKYMGAFGFLGLLPDYIGLGDSPGMHPYVHAETEANANIDMIRAAKEFCLEQSIELNGQLFITGYSQGGHAAMATVYEMETNLSEEFTVTASAPASGPYDLSNIQAEPMVSDQPYASPEYLPYVLFSYQSVYGNIFNTPSDFLVSPYDEVLPPMFNGMFSGSEIAAEMPEVPSLIIQPDELEAFTNDPEHPMRIALEDNDRYDWAPQHPMRLYYCTGDQQVFHENSIFTQGVMTANGAEDVELMDMGDFGHVECAQPTLFNILFWFEELKQECAGVSVEELVAGQMQVFPNPASEFFQLRFSEPEIRSISIVNMAGQIVFQQQTNSSEIHISTDRIAPGLYTINVDGKTPLRSKIAVH